MRLRYAIGLAGLAVGLTATEGRAIPAWARKYNMNCSGCHYPAPPRLNTTGQLFKWAGYRMPEEIGERALVQAVQNYIAARGRIRYTSQTQSGTPATSGFTFDDATIFYAGPLLTNFSSMFEFERGAPDELELTAHVSGLWGTQRGYGGFRVGNMHWLQNWGLAGFDRPTAISRPAAFGKVTTTAIPFNMANNAIGLEGYYVTGRTRLSAEVVNGIDTAGVGDEGDTEDAAKDVVVIFSHILDNQASGVTGVAYYGTLGRTSPSHFVRVGASANKVWQDNEILAGYLYSQDRDLPLAAPNVTGQAYFLGLQRYFRSSGLTLLGRYDFLDPDNDVSDNGYSVFTAAAVLPIGTPQYIRLALEGSITDFQSAATNSRTKLVAELQINF